MHVFTYVRSLFSALLGRFANEEVVGKSSSFSEQRDPHSVEFLRFRLRSLDKMLASPEVQPETRAILEEMRFEIQRELTKNV